MNTILSVRKRLEVTQAGLAEALGVSQGNVSHYERGQTIPPDIASRLIAFAKTRGLSLSFDDIYRPINKAVSDDSDAFQIN